ncbi:hypothetical protein CEXT_559051 [Caerostris extrusa]|uniref:Uncharacterized protein n=1 Tax=Caerostris extrusa TaxID=172846 RepID=A0AAV4Q9I4_CAEEX|nr:hypothetical protein CEXT_559051 [Caerostris extrusa]
MTDCDFFTMDGSQSRPSQESARRITNFLLRPLIPRQSARSRDPRNHGKEGQDSLGARYSSRVLLCGNDSIVQMISLTDSGSLAVVMGLQMAIFFLGLVVRGIFSD